MRVTTSWVAGQGGPYFSTMFFDGDGALLAQDAVEAVAAFWSACGSHIVSTCDATVSPEVYVVDATDGDTTALHTTTPPAVTTTDAGESAPWTTQGLVRWTTGVYLDGRQIRGRTFVPQPSEASNTSGRPSAAYLADIGPAAAALVTAGGLGIWRRPRLADAGPPVVTAREGSFHLVTGSSVWTDWAVLRSRRS